MTFEQAKSELMQIYGALSPNKQRAIDTLVKIEPCEDVIDRAEAMTEIMMFAGNVKSDEEDIYIKVSDAVQLLRDLPSVNPKEPKYCDRNICIKNEYNGIGCDECEVTKSQEPKTGEWIGDAKTYYEELNKRGLGVDEYTPYFTDDIACSECLAKYSMLDNETQFFKYCPNCGAKMVETQESEARND